ncbi:MAG: tail fiber protein [Phycisphaeraceae bacterium]|nr:tail fiber protein [Phycisphaeraceae bacterium]
MVILAMAALMAAGAGQAAADDTAYVGEIRMVAFSYAPTDWLPCEGQELEISKHTALYSLLGTTYGGDGRTNFKLPDLRGATIKAGDRTVPVKYIICVSGLYPQRP